MGGNVNYWRAIEVYDQLAADPEEPIHWRNQALFKKGLCLEKETDRAGALATFYKVLENEARPDRRRELFWFYKAGFNAARLLEDDSKWESAAAIYQRLAAAGGSDWLVLCAALADGADCWLTAPRLASMMIR